MRDLFGLEDLDEARACRERWGKAAKSGMIPELVRLSMLKEKRTDGFAVHARHCISTGRIEGFNIKIKVARRIAMTTVMNRISLPLLIIFPFLM